MSYHEGSNWQARKEDEGKPLYEKENKPSKQSSPIGVAYSPNNEAVMFANWKDEYLNSHDLPNGELPSNPELYKIFSKAAAPKADVKSKEEILDRHINYTFLDKDIHKILAAMEEYANQFKPQEKTFSLNDMLGFLDWVDGQGYECTLHDDENVKHWEKYPDVQRTGNRRERWQSKTSKELLTDYFKEKHGIDLTQ